MPSTVTLLATFAAAWVGGGTIVSTAVFYGVSALIYGGISVGLNFLSQAFMPRQQQQSQPRPEDVQTSFRQPAQARVRHYGQVKISGPWVFADSRNGNFYKVMALGEGPIDGIVEYWVDDEQVGLDGSGNVNVGDRAGHINIQTRLGTVPETAYGMGSVFPEWTAAHRGDGVASIFVTLGAVANEDFFKVYPNGINTSFRLVIRGVKVFNPATAVTEYSSNAAAVIRDYMTHAEGMRLPEEIFTTPLAATGWAAAYARAQQTIAKKDGGIESRYNLWGSYYLNERPADVLGRMLGCCDGRIYPTSDGGIVLDIGTWREPAVILDEDAIVGFSDLSRGRDVLTTANVIRATYLGVDQDYQAIDADPWIDADDVALRGEIEADTSFVMSPSHGQARRLMKLAAYRANPRWIGAFQCNLRGLAALAERFVRIRYPLFEIDEVFEVQDYQLLIGEGNILQGVMLQVQSMPEAAYSWDASQEEGDAPSSETVAVDRTIPVPTGFAVSAVSLNISGSAVAIARLSWTAPPAASLRVEARGKKTSESAWQPIPVQPGSNTVDSWALDDGVEYEFQIRHLSQAGRGSNWTASILLTAYGDPTPPAALTGVSATGGPGRATIAFTTPGSANLAKVKIYRRSSVGTPVESDLIATINVSQSQAYSFTDGDPATANAFTNSDFASGTGWTAGTGWAVAAGVATKTAGTASYINQVPAVSAGQVWRFAGTVSGWTAGTLWGALLGATPVFTTPSISGNGLLLGKATAGSGHTGVGFFGGATFAGSIDNVTAFVETAASAPQGAWQYYVRPVNRSNYGNVQGPFAATVA